MIPPILIGIGILAAGFLSSCRGKKEDSDEEVALERPRIPVADFKARPRGIPLQFFAENAVLNPQLLAKMERIINSCERQWVDDKKSCAAGVVETLSPEELTTLNVPQIRSWAINDLADFYEEYLKQSNRRRVAQRQFIRLQTLEGLLLKNRFGPPLTNEEIEEVLAQVRWKTGLTHIPPPREKPISWEEIESSREPVCVRIQDIPKEMQEMAKKLPLPREFAAHVSLPNGTLWDFLTQHTETVTFANEIPVSSPHLMLGEANTLFFKTILLNVKGWKQILGSDFRAGLLSTLGHETYHNFFHHRLKRNQERYVDAYLLNERNGELLEASILKQILLAEREEGIERQQLEKIALAMGNSLFVVVAT